MGTLGVVFIVFAGVVAVLNVTIGGAMLLRSRHQPDEILWRRQRLVAPRLSGSLYLFLGLTFAAVALGDVLFEPGSVGDGLAYLATMAFAGGSLVAGVLWFRRRGTTTPRPTSSG